MSRETKTIWAIAGGIVAIILFLILNPLVIIKPGTRGVLVRMGATQDRILEEGIHWVAPIIYKIKRMDVTIQKEERSASASSKDMQTVTSRIAINYHLDPLAVNILYPKLKRNYSSRVIAPAIEEFVKQTTAQFTAEELITKREQVKQDLKKALTENLATHNIIVDDVFITDFSFSEGFNKSIEAKVTAEQRALESKNKLEQVKYEAEQKITQAKAEAESIRIQAEAINSQGGEDYVQLQAIAKWNGVLPTQMIPGATVPILNLTR